MLREPPSHIQEAITRNALRDLEPPLLAVELKLGLSALVGGFLSLVVCGQFGLGVTSWADALNHNLHAHAGPIPCALICGVLFAVFPIGILRFLLSSPLQFRVLMRHHQVSLLLWFAGLGGLLTLFGEHSQGIMEYTAWVIAAIAAANGLARLANLVAPTWHPPRALTTLGV